MNHIVLITLLATASCGRKNFEVDASTDAADADAASTLPLNYAFVTSTQHRTSEYGSNFAGADAICNARAAAAGLPGTYVAYLSTDGVTARNRLGTARGWQRVDGRPLLDRPSDLANRVMYHPLRIDETGADVGVDYVHTGTDGSGVSDIQNCTNYTSTSGMIAVGRTAGTSSAFSKVSELACTSTARLYCFGIDHSNPLVIMPAIGRRMFMSVQLFTPDAAGIAKADDLCRDEALLVGYSGTFIAFLATTTASAMSRLSLNGPTWVRPDGLPLAATPLDLAAVTMLTTPNVASNGTYTSNVPVLTGALTPVEPAFDGSVNCADWSAPGGTAIMGDADQSHAWMLAGQGNACTGHVYCFEQ